MLGTAAGHAAGVLTARVQTAMLFVRKPINARVGISKAMLSKVENAQTSCSLATLALLARGLDVPVTTLLRGADTERPSSLVKAGSGTRSSARARRSVTTTSCSAPCPASTSASSASW